MGIQEALRKAAEMQSHLQIISVVEYGPYWIFSYCEPGLTPEECPGMPMLKMRRTDGFSTYLHVQDKDFLDIVKHATKVDLPSIHSHIRLLPRNNRLVQPLPRC